MNSLPKPKLNITLVSKAKDFFGVWEVEVFINKRFYTYPVTSEYALHKIESLIRTKKYGKAIQVLQKFTTKNE